MFDIGNSVTWKNSASVSACLIRELGHGPFEILRKGPGDRAVIKYRVPFKKRRRTGRLVGVALVPRRLLKNMSEKRA